MNEIFKEAFLKVAGGPGSGVSEDNVKEIDFLESSPLISIGYRKKFMSERSPDREGIQIDVAKIKYKGQENYVPKKLKRMLKAIESGEAKDLFKKPVKILRDEKGDYHIIDGHHRALAAVIKKIPKIKADVYTMNVIHKKAQADTDKIKENRRKAFMFGYHGPTKALGLDRVDPVEENKPGRPAAFQ